MLNHFIRKQTVSSQFLANVVSNIGVYFVNLLIGMWMTPYLIGHLGIALYGLIPLANSVTSYLSLLTLSLNGAVGRFLAIDLQKNDQQSANRTFNTSLIGVSTIALVSLPFLALFSYFVPAIFNIPPGETLSAQLLFFFVFLSFFITEIDTSFSVSSWAKSRFDLRNRILILSNALRLIVLVAFFTMMTPGAWQVGLGILVASLYVFSGDFLLWRKLTPELSINPSKFDSSRVRQLFGMGGWVVVNQMGSLLFLNIDLIVANMVLGANLAGEYGSILLFSTLLRGLAGTVSGVLTPTVVSKFALNDLDSMTRVSAQAVRLMGMAVGLPVGLICGLGGVFLQLWLGKDFGSLWFLLVLMVFHLPINLAVTPLFGIQQALNKVKIPGIVTLLMGIANLSLALFFTITLKWGVYGIAAAAAIVLTLKNAIFTPAYSAYIQKLPWHTYIRAIVPGVVVILLIGFISFGTTLFTHIDNWGNLMLTGAVISFLFLGSLFLFGFRSEDKAWILGFMPSFGKSN